MRCIPALFCALAILLPGLTGKVSADNDYDRARQALAAGQIRPLGQIVGIVQLRCGGRVIEVELDDHEEYGRHTWFYLLRMMRPTGDVLSLTVNAATTQIVRIRGHNIPVTCQ